MKHYQTPNTQFVRLSSGEVMQAEIIFPTIAFTIDTGGGYQESAMTPRRIYGI